MKLLPLQLFNIYLKYFINKFLKGQSKLILGFIFIIYFNYILIFPFNTQTSHYGENVYGTFTPVDKVLTSLDQKTF